MLTPRWFTRKDGKVEKVVAIIRVTGSHAYRKAWVRLEDGYERWVFWNWLTDVEPEKKENEDA